MACFFIDVIVCKETCLDLNINIMLSYLKYYIYKAMRHRRNSCIIRSIYNNFQQLHTRLDVSHSARRVK